VLLPTGAHQPTQLHHEFERAVRHPIRQARLNRVAEVTERLVVLDPSALDRFAREAVAAPSELVRTVLADLWSELATQDVRRHPGASVASRAELAESWIAAVRVCCLEPHTTPQDRERARSALRALRQRMLRRSA
jgi:hypothetical protein